MKRVILVLILLFCITSCRTNTTNTTIDNTNNNPEYIVSVIDNNPDIRSLYLSAIVIYETSGKEEAINLINYQYSKNVIDKDTRDLLIKAINNVNTQDKFSYP